MGKNKLKRFEENLSFANLFQPSFQELTTASFHLKGCWSEVFFENNNPLVIELGCGKGEYTTGLARAYPQKNFIGIDIKGARIWRGLKTTEEQDLQNVAFIRSKIEHIEHFFDKNEVDEIWITFPDPQPRQAKSKKRLTSPQFLERYKKNLKPDGIIHLKTDDTGLYEFTLEVIKEGGHKLLASTADLYIENAAAFETAKGIQTFYEQMWLDMDKKINYICFKL